MTAWEEREYPSDPEHAKRVVQWRKAAGAKKIAVARAAKKRRTDDGASDSVNQRAPSPDVGDVGSTEEAARPTDAELNRMRDKEHWLQYLRERFPGGLTNLGL